MATKTKRHDEDQTYLPDGEGGTLTPPVPPPEIQDLVSQVRDAERRRAEADQDVKDRKEELLACMKDLGITGPITVFFDQRPQQVEQMTKEYVSIKALKSDGE